MTQIRVVLVTVPDEKTGLNLARALVEERLAACVNILPGVRSVYRWEGRVEDDRELLLVAKTSFKVLDRLIERVAQVHPYDQPEIISLPVDQGSPGYLDWVLKETGDPE